MNNMKEQDEFYLDPEERAQLEKQWKEEKARQERHDRLWSNFDAARENRPEFREWFSEQEKHLYFRLQEYRLQAYSNAGMTSEQEQNLSAPIQSLVDSLVEDFDLPGKLQRMSEICEKHGIRAVKPLLDSVHKTVNEFLVTRSTEYKKDKNMEADELYFFETAVRESSRHVVDAYGCYVANSGEHPRTPFEDYQRFNEFAMLSETIDSDFQEYLCEWEEHVSLKRITEIKKADAELYIQKNFSCSLEQYEDQMEPEKRPELWDKFDAAKKNNPGLQEWIDQQKADVVEEVNYMNRITGFPLMEQKDAELISRKVEAYAFYVHSACGGNTYLNPYAEYKRFTEFRNNPEFNTENSLADKHRLDDIGSAKKDQARRYIRDKFSCDLEEYEEKKKQLNVNKAVKKGVDLDF